MSYTPTAPRDTPSIFDSSPSFCLYTALPTSAGASINYLIVLQNQALQQIAEQNRQMAALINRISDGSAARAKSVRSDSLSHSEKAPSQSEDLPATKLVQEGELLTPILKERGFVLCGAVRDAKGEIVPQAAGTRLVISLFTQDAPNQPLTVNIAGKKALRGTITTEVKEDGTFRFNNVVINEVSSHYIDDVFTLVVSDEAESIKPLTIRRLSVRARKAKGLEVT